MSAPQQPCDLGMMTSKAFGGEDARGGGVDVRESRRPARSR